MIGPPVQPRRRYTVPMSTQAAPHLLTAEEFFDLADSIEGGKLELVRGEVITHMPVGGVHSKIAGLIIKFLLRFIDQHAIGEVGPELGVTLQRNPDIVFAPDVAFVASDRLPGGVLPEGLLEGPPTLAVEIVSPNDRDHEVSDKVDEYLRCGTPRVWVVRPRTRTVTVYRPDNTARIYHRGETLDSDDAGFPAEGFALPLDDLFD